MLHVRAEIAQRVYCGTESDDGDPSTICPVCLDLHEQVDRMTRPHTERLIAQYQRGLLSSGSLASAVYLVHVSAEEQVMPGVTF